MNIGSTIKDIRKEQNITQTTLAAAVGVTSSAISQIESNRTTPHQNTLVAICECLNVSLPYIYVRSISIEDIDDTTLNHKFFTPAKNLMLIALSKK